MNLARIYAEQICPACGYKLDFTPWADLNAKEQVCPCCGILFGYDDLNESTRAQTYLMWRQRWIDNRSRWWSKNPIPPDYKPGEQLAKVERLASQR